MSGLNDVDVVCTLVDKEGFPAGSIGTVVDVHPAGELVLVEFSNDAGETLDLVSYQGDELQLRR